MDAATENPSPTRTPRKRSLGRLRGMWKHKKTGRWYWSPMRNGKRVNINLETTDESEAIRKALEASGQPEALGLPSDLEKEIADYIAEKVRMGVFSRFTKTQRTEILGQFAKWVQVPIARISPATAKDYYHWQQTRDSARTGKPLKEVTIQSYIISIVAPFFEWLVATRKVLSKNPFRGIEMRRISGEEATKERFCSRARRDAILAASLKIPETVLPEETARWISFVLHVGFEAGFRKNEIIECRPEWINLDLGIISVLPTETFTPKTREKRTVPLSRTLKAFLEGYTLKGTWCIAPKVERGRSNYRYDFERPYGVAMQYIGEMLNENLDMVTPHVMRHTFASLLAIAGISLYKISKWLGDTLRTTERHYAHLQGADSDIDATRAPERKPSKGARRRRVVRTAKLQHGGTS